MAARFKVREFFKREECEAFLNEFSSKKVLRREVTPLLDDGRVRYVVVVEMV